MTKMRLTSIAAGFLAVLSVGCAVWAGDQAVPFQDRLEGMKKEIRILNLVNGLDLTVEQMERILSLAEQARGCRAEHQRILDSLRSGEEMALAEISSFLRENMEVPKDTAVSFHRISQQGKQAGLLKREEMLDLIRQTERVLEPHQIHQMRQYVPCIIPPRGEARIGQAADFGAMTRNFERIRKLPQQVYRMRRWDISQRTLEMLKLRAAPAMNGDETELLSRIVSLYDRLRLFDEAEFAIEKEKLAAELLGLVKPEKAGDRLERKIEGFLLSPEIIPLLVKRVNRSLRF